MTVVVVSVTILSIKVSTKLSHVVILIWMEPTINLIWLLTKHFVKDPPFIDLKNRPAIRACSYCVLVCIGIPNTMLFSMFSYFRKGCCKAYAPIPLGIMGVYAWALIERQPFLNWLYTAISSKIVAAQVYTPRPQRSMWGKNKWLFDKWLTFCKLVGARPKQ